MNLSSKKRLFASVGLYDSGLVAIRTTHCKILAEDRMAGAIGYTNIEPENATRICIDTAVNLKAPFGELIMPINRPYEVRPRDNIFTTLAVQVICAALQADRIKLFYDAEQ